MLDIISSICYPVYKVLWLRRFLPSSVLFVIDDVVVVALVVAFVFVVGVVVEGAETESSIEICSE